MLRFKARQETGSISIATDSGVVSKLVERPEPKALAGVKQDADFVEEASSSWRWLPLWGCWIIYS